MRGVPGRIALAWLVMSACASSSMEATGSCRPVPDGREFNPGATLVGAEGSYRLTLVATSGPEAGDRDSGSLELVATGDPVNPLIGWSTANPEALGAYELGGLRSEDPDRPGVRVLEGESGIVVRLGADANRAGARPFDGGYTVLRVEEVDADGFRGSWESGIDRVVASGFFCADRTETA